MTNGYEMLRPDAATKDEGGFVKTLQGQTGTGFEKNTHVHKDWYAKTQSFEEGMEALEKGVAEREDVMVPRSQITPAVNLAGEFVMQLADGREFKPTQHAVNQFGVSTFTSTFFLNSLMSNPEKHNGEERFQRDEQDADTLVAVCENALRRVDGSKQFRLRTYQDGTLRAFLTEKYAPIDNRWYLEQLENILPGGRLSHWRGDADTIYGNILLPDTIIDYGQDDDTDYGGMISIGNCEIGTRRVSQTPSIFRAICMNGCIWGQAKGKSISKVHRGKIDIDGLAVHIRHNIEAQLPLLPDGIERFLGVKIHTCDEVPMKNLIGAVCSDKRLGKKESIEVLTQWIQHERNDRNLFGVVNAITRAGQEFDNTSWVKFDELGGSLLDMTENRWDALKKRADTYEEKEVEAIFGTVFE
jgi:hypothetical protein